jgi:hypothetical protein
VAAVKWFQVDSDTPNDPKIKAIIRHGLADGGPKRAAELVGQTFLLWCYIANHGEGTPGMGVKADGSPLVLAEMADECLLAPAGLKALLDLLVQKGVVDAARWDRGVVYLPGMAKRADTYTRQKGRATAGETGQSLRRSSPDQPLQHSTRQNQDQDQRHVPDGTAPPADLLTGVGENQVDALVRIWNADRQPGPKVTTLTDSRRRAYGRALKAAPDLSEWRQVIALLNVQQWANAAGWGEHANWRASLDWLAKPGKLAEKLDAARADHATVQTDGRAGRSPAKGRTGTRPGQFAQALKGGGDGSGGGVH